MAYGRPLVHQIVVSNPLTVKVKGVSQSHGVRVYNSGDTVAASPPLGGPDSPGDALSHGRNLHTPQTMSKRKTAANPPQTVREKDHSPGALTRAALLTAAALPWFAVFSGTYFSGTYELYFYILVAAMLLAEWLSIPLLAELLVMPLLVLAALLGVLLLLVMPAGTIYAALRRPPAGWAGRLTRAGCLVSMGFAFLYSGLMVVMLAVWFLQEGVDDSWGPFLAWRIVVMVIGLWATWRAWRWLRRRHSHH